MVDEKLSSVQTLKDTYNNTLYIKDNKAYRKYEFLETYHNGILKASR